MKNWISVKEKMPNKLGKQYSVKVDDGRECVAILTKNGKGDKVWLCPYYANTVTHWAENE